MTKRNAPVIIYIFRGTIIIFIWYVIAMHPLMPRELKALYMVMILVLHMNDYFRNTYQLFEKNRMIYYISMIVSIVGIGYFMIHFDSLPVDIYFVFPVVEIFLYNNKIQFSLLSIHILVFLYTMVVLKAGFQEALFPYLSVMVLIYMFRLNSLEREKGLLLNAELAETNAKLKEITIVKERTRIAQELHDSIGHALIALKMHLEFAENMMDVDPNKSKSVISKALVISQKSITDLRKAVAILKDASSWKQRIKLQESIDDLIQSLQTRGKLTFNLNFEPSIDYTSHDIKNTIYSTVREAITNGIKHGNAQSFHIDILKNDDWICLTVEDDGQGCDEIVKSHGIRGIEERIEAMKGNVDFSSAKDQGFILSATLPFVMEKE